MGCKEVYQKPNGKWYARYQVDNVRRHRLCTGATTKQEALKMRDAFRYKLQQELNGVIPKEQKQIIFSKLMTMYLTYSKTNKKSYDTDVSRNKYILEFFGKQTCIKDIHPEKIEAFKNYLLEKGRSKSTVNRYLEQLSKAFSIAVDNEYLHKNPCKSVKKFPMENHSVRYLTDDEEKRLFQVLPEHLKGIVIIALNTGLRKANILNLTWEQVNFEFSFIEILKNKGNKHIYIPINDTLARYFDSIPDESKRGFMFVNPETNLPFVDIKKAWKTALKEANIENFRFHDLRHTVGTRLAKENVPVNVIKEILAHSDVKTTMRYVHCTRNAKLDALNKLHAC